MGMRRTNRWKRLLAPILTFLGEMVLNSITRFFLHPVLAISAGRGMIEPEDNHIVLQKLPKYRFTSRSALYLVVGILTWPFFAAAALIKFVFMAVALVCVAIFAAGALAVSAIADKRSAPTPGPSSSSPVTEKVSKKNNKPTKSTTAAAETELTKFVNSSDRHTKERSEKKIKSHAKQHSEYFEFRPAVTSETQANTGEEKIVESIEASVSSSQP